MPEGPTPPAQPVQPASEPAAPAVAVEGAGSGTLPRSFKEVKLPILIVSVIVLVLPLFLPQYMGSLVTKMMYYGLFGLSLNIIWGYAGIPSFGHAAFYGVGAYTAGVLALKGGIGNFWLTLLAAIVATAVVAAILGIPAFRVFGVGAGATNPIYFLLATLAFGELLSRLAISARPVTGGSTGLSGIPEPSIGFGLTLNSRSYYYLVFVVLAVCTYLIYRVVNSHYGYALRGIHDNERRMQALGYNTWLYKYTSWIIAAVFGGIAGVLFVYDTNTILPRSLAMATSDIAFLLVIMGSTTVFFGPLVAAVVFVGVEYLSSLYLPARWPLIFGAMFVFTIMVIPQGLGVWVLGLWRRIIRGSS